MSRCKAVANVIEIDEYELTAETTSETRCSKDAVGASDWCEEHEHEWGKPQ